MVLFLFCFFMFCTQLLSLFFFFFSDSLNACFTNLYCPIAGGLDNKESTCNAGDPGSIPGLGRSPREGHGNPLKYSCLENPMDEEPGGL